MGQFLPQIKNLFKLIQENQKVLQKRGQSQNKAKEKKTNLDKNKISYHRT